MSLIYFIEGCDCVKKNKRLPTYLLLGVHSNIQKYVIFRCWFKNMNTF